MIEKEFINGLNFYRINKNDSVYIDVNGVDENNLDFILDFFPVYRSLCFYDHFFPQRSDPGAYITVYHYKYEFAYWMGNHGWSTLDRFRQISKFHLKRYILKNIKYNENIFGFRRIGEKEDQIEKRIAQDFYDKNQLTDLNAIYPNLFEVNGYYLIKLDPSSSILNIIKATNTSSVYIRLNEEHTFIVESGTTSQIHDMIDELTKNKHEYKDQMCIVK